jgi:maltose alpha-D-glucosyltransferase / alpha-amylase
VAKHVHHDNDPFWYKDAIIYEVHVRAFMDSSGDGMGDFAGLTRQLGYLQDLGVTAIWVLPFCPSPWRDDGYDISDYENVHPAYGSMRDFQNFLREAHRRGLYVITELVLNHTSDQHVWFQRSRRAAPGSRWRNYYVWSDAPERYKEARIIFKDFETSNWTWDTVAKAYYWHRFYSHQPDLNFDNAEVRRAMLNAVDFWFGLGVDGLRLDAVPYLYEREGTNCENLPETHAFLKELRAHVDSKFRGRMLLAEANQWPEDAIAYFGHGDECHMAFQFPLMPRLFMSIRMEDHYPVTDIQQLTPAIPDNCQWALFLRNHDELTLEMVTDEERDYMYRVYAHDRQMRINLGIRRRLAPLLENDRRRIELMNALLMSLPGTPVIYYGDEIGMGDNFYLGDRNGVRTPMQWNGDRNAGFSRANPQKLYLPVIIDPEYHYETVNVETQQNNSHSLLWFMKRLLAQRKQWRAFGRGSIEFVHTTNRHVLAFVRQYEDERVLVVANLSRFTQFAEIELAGFKSSVPLELFGKTDFPAITDRPYLISLGPHGFDWFSLESRTAVDETLRIRTGEPPTIAIESWDNVFTAAVRSNLNRLLPYFLKQRKWFHSRDRAIRVAEIQDVIPFPQSGSYVLLVRVEFTEGDPELYSLPVAVSRGDGDPRYTLAILRAADGSQGTAYSAFQNRAFCDEILLSILRRRRVQGEKGEVVAAHTRQMRSIWGHERPALEAAIPAAGQDNTTVFFGDRFALKFFRKIEPGINPEREMGAMLTEVGFPNAPTQAGSIHYHGQGSDPALMAVLNSYTIGGIEAWQYTQDQLGIFFERAMAQALTSSPTEQQAAEIAASYLHFARLLGIRTAEMHLALASRPEDPAFAPEPYTDFYRYGLYHGMLGKLARITENLRRALPSLPEDAKADATAMLARQPEINAFLQFLRDRRVNAVRIRIHGDFHLAQAIYTGKDFVFLDFEGDPARPLSERRIKRSPLQDVCGMLDSFYHASQGVILGETPGVIPKPDNLVALTAWAKLWRGVVGGAYLGAYVATPGIAALLPPQPEDLNALLRLFLLEWSLRKLSYVLAHDPERVRIPCHAILDLLEAP